MANKDALGGKKRDVEEDYFRKQDQALIDKMRKESEAAASRREMGEKTGLTDPLLIAELEQLGFTSDTVALLPVVPVVQVAWAEGGVSSKERDMVVRFARGRGIQEGSAADVQLTEWLNTRPADEIFAKATRLIRVMLAAGGETTKDLNPDDLVAYCQSIAAASGGIFGIGSVSSEEKAVLEGLAQALKNR